MAFVVPVPRPVRKSFIERKYGSDDSDDSDSFVGMESMKVDTLAKAVRRVVQSAASKQGTAVRGVLRSYDDSDAEDDSSAYPAKRTRRATEGRTVGGPSGVDLLPTGPDPVEKFGPGGTAGRGTHGLPGVNYVVSRNKPIRSHHRTSVTATQVTIVINCDAVRPDILYNERKALAARLDPSELLAPLGTVNCFKSHKGELVYQIQDGNGAPFRDVSAYSGYPRVFSCVNGLSASVRIMFAGYMVFNQTAEHPDPEGTLQIAGTCTVTHCGPFPIKSLQLVYFSKYPYVRVGDNGLIEPAIREVGIPGQSGEMDVTSGESLAKFKPALYALNDQDTNACLKDAEKLIRAEIEANAKELKNSGGASFLALVNQIVQRVWNLRFITDARDLPVVKYAEIFVWSCAFQLVECSGTEREKEAARDFFDKIREHYKELRNASASLKDALGSNLIGYTHPSLRPGVESEITDETYYPASVAGAAAAVGTVTLPVKTWSNSERRLGQVLVAWAQELCDFYRADQEDFLRAHVIGTALKDAVSGRDLDIMLGYFFR